MLNDIRLSCNSSFKKAIRLAMVNIENGVSDKLADKLQQSDKGFCSQWNAVFRVASNHNTSVEGNTDPSVIVNEFVHYFAGNFFNFSTMLC